MGFRLTVAAGEEEAGREFSFEARSVTVGRSADCDIVLPDPGVSRHHARIFAEGDLWFVEDPGSSNGTRVNGKSVRRNPLAEGDSLTIGPVVMRFSLTSDDPSDRSTRLVQAVPPKLRRSRGRIDWKLARVAAAVLGFGALGLLFWRVLAVGEEGRRGPREPTVLTRVPIRDSFGWGAEVRYPRPDQKAFDFELIAPVRALVLVHFQARDISTGEVKVACNGVEVGHVPADTLDAADRVLELVLSPAVLRRGEKNQIVFDNLRNPPGEETWQISNLSIEPVVLPELPVDELQLEAKASFERGVRNMDLREVGAENRYQAWREFRNAWLLLEGHPEPRPALYEQARARMQDAQRELDVTCSRLMLEVETWYNQQNLPAARSTLDHVRAFFPNENDQHCRAKAEKKRFEYDL
jgi:hypothetical protein